MEDLHHRLHSALDEVLAGLVGEHAAGSAQKSALEGVGAKHAADTTAARAAKNIVIHL